MSTNSAGGIIFAGLYLVVAAAHYAIGCVASPCRDSHVSMSRSLFWPAALKHDVIQGTSSLSAFVLSNDCRELEYVNPRKWEELIRQAAPKR